MMDYYFNEYAFLQEQPPTDLPEQLKEFKQLFNTIEQNQGRLMIKDTFRYDDLCKRMQWENRGMYAIPFQLFGKCGHIAMENCKDFAVNKIVPEISCDVVRELIYACCRDQKERMVSLSNDREAVADEYYLEQAALTRVVNLRSVADIEKYSLNHPYPKNMKEVFDRVEEKFPDISFMKNAYKTAAKRESAYRKIGYDEVLFVFKIMNEKLLPFYRNKTQGKSEADMFREIRDTYNIDISAETKKTIDLYGAQREVQIEATTHMMSNHIKFNKDACRIHFKYIKTLDKIYIGHSGKHLDTADG